MDAMLSPVPGRKQQPSTRCVSLIAIYLLVSDTISHFTSIVFLISGVEFLVVLFSRVAIHSRPFSKLSQRTGLTWPVRAVFSPTGQYVSSRTVVHTIVSFACAHKYFISMKSKCGY